MAGLLQDVSQLATFGISLRPQNFATSAGGVAVQVYPFGSNMLNARLDVGAVNTLTSLIVKVQVSTDNSNWDDVTGAVFTTVTAANAGETISFQLPKASSTTAAAYTYVRLYGTLVGTSAYCCGVIFGQSKYDGNQGWVGAPLTNN